MKKPWLDANRHILRAQQSRQAQAAGAACARARHIVGQMLPTGSDLSGAKNLFDAKGCGQQLVSDLVNIDVAADI